MSQPPAPRARGRSPLPWIVLLAAVVALLDLGGRSLNDMDVPRSASLAREMADTGSWLVPTRAGEIYANKPPLYLWLVAVPTAIAGDVSPFLARLPAALAFVALVGALGWWTHVRTRSRGASAIAALLGLSTLTLVWLGREARLDMLAAALTVWGTARLDRAALGRGGSADRGWAGALLGLALLTKGPLLLLVPLAVLLLGGPRARLRARLARAHAGRVLALAAGIALLWFVPALIAGGSDFARVLLFEQASDRLSGQGNHLQGLGYYFAVGPFAALPWGPLCFLAMLASLLPRGARSLGPVAGLARAALVLVVLFSLVPTKHVRYLAPVLPLAVPAVAWWTTRWIRAGVRAAAPAGRAARDLVLAAVLVLAGGGVLVAGLASLYPSLDVLVPALGFAALAAWWWRTAGAPRGPAAGRARLVTAVLLAAVGAASSFALLRYRFRVPPKVAFERSLAALPVGDRTVLTVGPVDPEDMVLVARDVRRAPPSGEDLPAGALLVYDAARPPAWLASPPHGWHVAARGKEDLGWTALARD